MEIQELQLVLNLFKGNKMFKVLQKGCEPTRGSKYSACVDLYASEDVVINAGETKLVGLGVSIDIDMDTHMGNRKYGEEYKINKKPIYGDGAKRSFREFKSSHYLQLMLRSSLGKKGLILPNGVGIIDLDYKDEIKMIIHNPIKMSNNQGIPDQYLLHPFKIKKGDKIAQITLLEHKSYLFGIDTDKKRDSGFWSTGV